MFGENGSGLCDQSTETFCNCRVLYVFNMNFFTNSYTHYREQQVQVEIVDLILVEPVQQLPRCLGPLL